jgi:hypothetical protein
MTSTHSTHHSDSVSTTSSQLDSHAKTYPQRANRQDFEKALALASSTGLSKLLGVFDLSSSSLKTLQIPSVTATGRLSKKSSMKLPKSGTMLSGALYQLKMWEPVTSANASGLLPTPTTQDTIAHPNAKLTPNGRRLSSNGTTHSLNLQDRLTLLPTPTASDVEGGIAKDVQFENNHFFRQNKQGTRWGVKLRDVAPHLPTPRASEWKGIGVQGSKSSLRWAEQGYLTGVLNETCSLPTGQATHLNPSFVEEMMGYPIGWTDLRH